MKKIKYIIRKRALGDVLWIEPILRKLSLKYEQLIVYTKYNQLFENYPAKNIHFKDKLAFWEKILVAGEKALGISLFTINLDDTYEKTPQVHFLHAYQKAAGLTRTEDYPKIYLSETEKQKSYVKGPYAILHIESFSTKKYRQLQGIEWENVVSYLKKMGFQVVQLSVKEKPLENTLHIPTSVRELICLISKADLFIGIDSGPSHIAASFGIPSLLIFGTLDPELRHFPTLFNGILLKNRCDPGCVHNISDQQELHCALADNDQTPPCCRFQTESIIHQIKKLTDIHATQNHQ